MASALGSGTDEAVSPAGEIEFDRIRLVLLDLDGTLVDSLPDLAYCGNSMLAELGLEQHDSEAARAWVGNGIDRFVKRFLTGEMQAEPQEELFERGRRAFVRIYADNVAERSRVYDGVFDGLDALAERGLHLGCVTNKAGSFTTDLLRAMRLDKYFELVVAGDTTPRKKPDPMPLHFAADHFGLESSECLMVGDSANDVKAARAAGFRVVAVPYGYNHGYSIQECNPDLVVSDLRELAELFSKGGVEK